MKMQRNPETYSTNATRRDEVKANQRFLHKSCEAFMMPNPLDPQGKSLPWIPYCTSRKWLRQHGVPFKPELSGVTYRKPKE